MLPNVNFFVLSFGKNLNGLLLITSPISLKLVIIFLSALKNNVPLVSYLFGLNVVRLAADHVVLLKGYKKLISLLGWVSLIIFLKLSVFNVLIKLFVTNLNVSILYN